MGFGLRVKKPYMAGTLRETLGWKSGQIISLRVGGIDIDSMTNTDKAAMTNTASEILGKKC